MVTAIISGIFALSVAVFGAFSQGARSRSLKEVETLVALRGSSATEDEQAQLSRIIKWRLEGLTFVTMRPRYGISRISIAALLMLASFGCIAGSQGLTESASKLYNSASVQLTAALQYSKQYEALSQAPDQQSKVAMQAVTKSMLDELNAANKKDDQGDAQVNGARWLLRAALALGVLSFLVITSLIGFVSRFFWATHKDSEGDDSGSQRSRRLRWIGVRIRRLRKRRVE